MASLLHEENHLSLWDSFRRLSLRSWRFQCSIDNTIDCSDETSLPPSALHRCGQVQQLLPAIRDVTTSWNQLRAVIRLFTLLCHHHHHMRPYTLLLFVLGLLDSQLKIILLYLILEPLSETSCLSSSLFNITFTHAQRAGGWGFMTSQRSQRRRKCHKQCFDQSAAWAHRHLTGWSFCQHVDWKT